MLYDCSKFCRCCQPVTYSGWSGVVTWCCRFKAFFMKKTGIIVLEGTSMAERSPSARSSSTMDCLFAAPGGLLFAVYFTPGEPGMFTSCSGQDILAATPSVFRGAMETGVLSFSGNIGLEICWLEQAWAALVETGNLNQPLRLLRSKLHFVIYSQNNRNGGNAWCRKSPFLQTLSYAEN